MFLTAPDFTIAKGQTARSEDLRARMDRVCRTVKERAARNEQLRDLVQDYYVGRNGDVTNQWFCLLPAKQDKSWSAKKQGFGDIKTMFIHFHCVLPQNGNYGDCPWLGLNAEFETQRTTLASLLADASTRAKVLDALRKLEGGVVWVAEKWAAVATAQDYFWKPRRDEETTPCADVSESYLRDLGRRLEVKPMEASDPKYLVMPAVVIGWFLRSSDMVGWGTRLPDEVGNYLERAAPLWRILARRSGT